MLSKDASVVWLVHGAWLARYNRVAHMHRDVLRCFVLVTSTDPARFLWCISQLLQGYFAGIGAIQRLPQCQWSNSAEYSLNWLVPDFIKHNIFGEKPRNYLPVCLESKCYVDRWYNTELVYLQVCQKWIVLHQLQDNMMKSCTPLFRVGMWGSVAEVTHILSIISEFH